VKIVISAIGKHIKPWMQDGIDTYLSRIPRQFTIQVQTLAPVTSKHSNQVKHVKTKEAERLLQTKSPQDYCIALDCLGESFDSEKAAIKLENLQSLGRPIRFFIGGAYGLDQSLLKQMDASWSLSKLTFPHGLARLILIEQLYRSICLNQNHPYHKS
jgi:23S rRNA (pseudouridine1915-N3)-methyltransferase